MFLSQVDEKVKQLRAKLRTEIETMGLTIVTLGECIQILEGTHPNIILPEKPLKEWQDNILGYRLPPKNNFQLVGLIEVLSEELASKCIRYSDQLERYQNVETGYIRNLIEERLRSKYDIPDPELVDTSDSDSDTSSDTSSEISESSESLLGHIDTSVTSSQDVYGLVFMKYGSQSIGELQNTLREQGIEVPTKPQSARNRHKKAKYKALLLDTIAERILAQERDDCFTETSDHEILLAMDTSIEALGIIPRAKFFGKPFSYLSKQPSYKAYSDKIKVIRSTQFQNFSKKRFSYNHNPLNRVHGFLVLRDNGCAVYDLENPPKISQLVVICSSTFSDRVPPEKPFTVGALLIGFYLFLVKDMKYDWSVLEVANECVGSDPDDEDDVPILYGSKEYLMGKNSQHPLFCFYERFGYREDPDLAKRFHCFSDSPYPSMKLVLSEYSDECLREVCFTDKWSGHPSSYCKSRLKNPHELATVCF